MFLQRKVVENKVLNGIFRKERSRKKVIGPKSIKSGGKKRETITKKREI